MAHREKATPVALHRVCGTGRAGQGQQRKRSWNREKIAERGRFELPIQVFARITV
jgi:hypothetical protein